MKFKMFSADGPAGIVAQVNAWLSGERGIAIRHTETRPVSPAGENQPPQLFFSVWYDQDSQ